MCFYLLTVKINAKRKQVVYSRHDGLEAAFWSNKFLSRTRDTHTHTEK